jgi:hypothetical protein
MQPVSVRPVVETGGVELGTLDMREWRTTIDAIDGLVAHTIEDGFFAVEAEREVIIVETFDDGRELVESVSPPAARAAAGFVSLARCRCRSRALRSSPA